MRTRVFFASDIHGSKKCFIKFVNAAKFYKADVLILGGDITAKIVVPVIKQPDGSYECEFMNKKLSIKTEKELDMWVDRIESSGNYVYITDYKEMEELRSEKKRANEIWLELIKESLRKFVSIAEQRLKGSHVRLFATGGNDDPPVVEEVLRGSDYIVYAEGKCVEIDNFHEMISTGYSNMTPWHCPRDIPEEELAKKIDDMASRVRDLKNCIFNFHCPPYDSGLDTAMELDGQLKVVVRHGQPSFIPVGSKAVRSAIEKYQPLLGLHGHIHESRGAVKISRTLCLNPGSEYSEGLLRGIIVELDRKGIKDYMFTCG